MIIFIIVDDQISFGKFQGSHAKKFLIIFPEHCYINIIIPRNKSLMSYCSEQGSAKCKPSYPMFFTYPVKFFKDPELCSPAPLHKPGDGKPVSGLIPEEAILQFKSNRHPYLQLKTRASEQTFSISSLI